MTILIILGALLGAGFLAGLIALAVKIVRMSLKP